MAKKKVEVTKKAVPTEGAVSDGKEWKRERRARMDKIRADVIAKRAKSGSAG